MILHIDTLQNSIRITNQSGMPTEDVIIQYHSVSLIATLIYAMTKVITDESLLEKSIR